MNFAGQPARLYSLPCCYTALYARGGRDLIRGSLGLGLLFGEGGTEAEA